MKSAGKPRRCQKESEDPQYLNKSNVIKLVNKRWKFMDLWTSSTENWESVCENSCRKDWMNYFTVGYFSAAKIL